jgi:hypothetical protein
LADCVAKVESCRLKIFREVQQLERQRQQIEMQRMQIEQQRLQMQRSEQRQLEFERQQGELYRQRLDERAKSKKVGSKTPPLSLAPGRVEMRISLRKRAEISN